MTTPGRVVGTSCSSFYSCDHTKNYDLILLPSAVPSSSLQLWALLVHEDLVALTDTEGQTLTETIPFVYSADADGVTRIATNVDFGQFVRFERVLDSIVRPAYGLHLDA